MSSIFRAATKAAALGGTGLGAAAIYRYQEVKNEQSKLPTNQLCSIPSNNNTANPNNPHKKNKKNVVIIGGGVVGITAAYKLALQGHSITLLEPNSQPGKECSACAAGGMQRSNPVVDRGTWVAVTKCIAPISRFILGGSDEPYKFFHICWLSTVTDPFFLRWSSTFTKTSFFPCKEQKYLQKEMLTFTDYAVRDMIAMMEDKNDPMAVRSGYNPNGSLSLSYDPPTETKNGTNGTKDAADAPPKAVKNPTGGNALEPSTTLTGPEITAREPSLLHQTQPPTTAKFEYESRAASSGRFTEELADRCEREEGLDVRFFYDTRVLGATATDTTDSTSGANNGSSGRRRVTQLQTNRGVIDLPEGTEVVVAAGAWTSHICAFLDLYAPVYPLKGYAMSVSAMEVLKERESLKAEDLPTRIVSDKYMYTSRLGDEIRITSIGEFSGWSTKPTPEVETEFRQEATRQFPQLQHYIQSAPVLCGHRPYVSDGILLLGRVDSFSNLLVSCGPGSNGWKLAMGSGEIVEKLVSGMTEEEISEELGFDANSFSPRGRVVESPWFSKLCRARWGV